MRYELRADQEHRRWSACRAGFRFRLTADRLFVANSWDDTISVIDTKTLAVVATWPVGAEPSSVVEDREGKQLFVANRISNDVAVLDAQTGQEEKRWLAGRGSSYLRLSPDGSKLYATHVYPNSCRAGPHLRVRESDAAGIGDHGDRFARAVVVDRIAVARVAASLSRGLLGGRAAGRRGRVIIPKILCRWRISNMAGHLPIH